MVAERYPSEEWIHVYTYDSQKSEACSTGLFFSVVRQLLANSLAILMAMFPFTVTKKGVSFELNLGNSDHMFTHSPTKATGGRVPKTTTTA
ncbi:hypothetical protein CDAR_413841 [Caerostris darwini]|uniref:Uncharacterized protein n=1 Tax=Caerostris darwini TaxID=1538125 RepID=A0AAV4UEU0_9ARAC|nr:hypothetical protein CDAR_413841 [Caerostris darwini]